jgi:hypothetical protein
MTWLGDLAGQGMIWSKSKGPKGEWALRLGEQQLATLRFRSAWGTLATGEADGDSWTFKRIGFFQNKVTVRSTRSDADVAVFVNDWKMGGTLQLPDGRRYRGNTNFWMTNYAFTDEEGRPLVSYRRIGGLTSISAVAEIEPAGAELSDLPWLVMLGWYLAVMLHQDATVVAVSGAAG